MVETVLVVSDTAKEYLFSDILKDFKVYLSDKRGYRDFLKKTQVDYIIAGKELYNDNIVCKGVKMISRCGHGTDNIQTTNIPITDCRGCLDNAVAETTVGYILIGCRNLLKYDRNCRHGNWNKILGTELNGLTVGIIGFGGIGQKVAELLTPFNVEILHYDIIDERKNCEFDYLLSKSDIITLHCDLNESSIFMIDIDAIKKMKDKCILINTSRGDIVNEHALIKNHKKFHCIILDVFNSEPIKSTHSLLMCRNVVCGIHSAGYSKQGQIQMAVRSFENVVVFSKKCKVCGEPCYAGYDEDTYLCKEHYLISLKEGHRNV